MRWNIAPEYVSTVILCIIWVYSRRGSTLPTLKNKLFQVCFVVTFGAMVSNILSTELIAIYREVPFALTWLVTTIYFIFTPLMGLVYCMYTVAVIYENQKGIGKILISCSCFGIVYFIVVLSNFMTNKIFDINMTQGYVQGEWINLTYLIFYLYCAIILVLILSKKSWIGKETYHILVAFPILATAVIIFQQLYPDIILTGAAATSALLIIYLHLQNKQISIDNLTNMPNRYELLNMISLILSRSNQTFVIIVVSLCDFKQINDIHGHHNGDNILKRIGEYLKSIATKEKVYRFNGDEFALLIQNSNEEHIKVLFQDIKKRMAEPWNMKDSSCSVAAVIGVIHYPETSNNLEGLIHGLEYAVKNAKADKINGLCYCSGTMLSERQRKNQVMQILKNIIKDGGFELFYQPIYSVDSGRFLFSESLMRILDSPLGTIYPSEFIPIAEDTGLIIPLTYQILDRACKFVRCLLEKGIEVEAVHVNFSAEQFGQANLADKIYDIIDANKIPYHKIKIEFTESAIAENLDEVMGFADQMTEKGIRLGLDDFGMGYSNLDSVIKIPFDTIKLDKSLIWSATKNRKSAVMVKNMTRTFHELGMKVLAEGVETEEQNRFVVECEMDSIQGFLYAKPMNEADTEKFLEQRS